MNRPDKWYKLPTHIVAHIANNLNELDYDPYESSRAEAIDQITNGYYDDMNWHTNYQYMQDAYNAYNDEELIALIKDTANGLRSQAETLDNYIDNITKKS